MSRNLTTRNSQQVSNTVNGVTPTPKHSLTKPNVSVNDMINNVLIDKLVMWIYHNEKFYGTILEVHGGNVTVDINGCKNYIPNFKGVKSKNIHVLPLTRISFVSSYTDAKDTNLLTSGK